MVSYRTSRIFQTLILIALIVLIVAAVVFGIRSAVTSGTTTSTDVGQSALLNTNAERSVRLTVNGPVVADENYRSYDIVVSPNFRTMTVYKGYTKTIIKRLRFNNNIPAYEQFVYTLSRSGFMNGDDSTNTDERGACPVGKIYEYETLQDSKTVKKLWTSTCGRGNTKSTYKAVSKLFNEQIIGANSIIYDIW